MSIEMRFVTVDKFEDFIALPANQERHFELIEGEIIEDMPTEAHSVVVANIYRPLYEYVMTKRLGRVVFEVRRRVENDDRNVFIPDLDFTTKERLNQRKDKLVRSGAVLQMPDLAVEVQSPEQSLKLMSDKASYYLNNGTHTVWLIYPAKRLVEILTRDSRQLLSDKDTLNGGELLPEFSMPVEDIFKTDEYS
ncbi:MAG: Uma2 family endonuclease [Aggregatilineales bacterium]